MRLHLFALIFSLTTCAPLAKADGYLPSGSSLLNTEVSTKLTNAERLARGLPLKPPRSRSVSARAVSNSAGATRLVAQAAVNGVPVGYLQYNFGQNYQFLLTEAASQGDQFFPPDDGPSVQQDMLSKAYKLGPNYSKVHPVLSQYDQTSVFTAQRGAAQLVDYDQTVSSAGAYSYIQSFVSNYGHVPGTDPTPLSFTWTNSDGTAIRLNSYYNTDNKWLWLALSPNAAAATYYNTATPSSAQIAKFIQIELSLVWSS